MTDPLGLLAVAVDALIVHVEENSDFVSPEVDRPVVADEGDEDEAEAAAESESHP